MSRIRSIKPEFWTSEQVLECSTNARLLFLGLWNFCDDCGRHPWSPKQAKAEVFPADDFSEKQIAGMLEELSKNGLICRYTFEGKEYFYVTGWKHQRIDKPQPPKYPDPFSERSKIIPRVIPPDTIRYDTIGEERKGIDQSPSVIECDWPLDFRERFWKQYPRKVGRKAALAKLEIVKKTSEVTFERLMLGVSKIPIKDPKYIPHPLTWLNQGRWDDEQLPLNGAKNETATAGDRARAFAQRLREIERSEGIGRSPDVFGGDGGSGETVRPIPQLQKLS